VNNSDFRLANGNILERKIPVWEQAYTIEFSKIWKNSGLGTGNIQVWDRYTTRETYSRPDFEFIQ
jgi:hypothetical protein